MATRIKGYCSHCFKNSYHIEQQWNILRRNVYVCEECKNSTVQCRLCQNFAKGGSFYDDEFCVEHDGTIKSFEEESKKKVKSRFDSIEYLDSRLGCELKKIKDGTGDIILFMDGFLKEESSNKQEWERKFEVLYPNNPWYQLSWKSKKLVDFISSSHFAKHWIIKKIAVPPPFHIPLAVSEIIKVWKGAKRSAEETGAYLGDVLKEIEDKQVILYGHSLGAKVIYHALIQISQQKSKINRTIIKEVHLLGGAESSSSDNWSYAKRCVSGVIFNYYSKNDDILKYLYQTVELSSRNPIGRNPIEVDGVVNIDVSSVVNGHSEYISNFSLLKNNHG
jgi:hypothetical protein